MCNLSICPNALNKFSGDDIIITENIAVAVIAMIGTCIGSFGGIITASKLTSYRLQKLEEKVDKHNRFAERMPVVEEQIKVINHRIEDLEYGSVRYEN